MTYGLWDWNGMVMTQLAGLYNDTTSTSIGWVNDTTTSAPSMPEPGLNSETSRLVVPGARQVWA